MKPRSTAEHWPRFSGPRFWLPKLLALFCWGILAAGLGFLLLLAVADRRHALLQLLAALAGAAGLFACVRARRTWRPAAALLGAALGLLTVAAWLARGPARHELEAEGGELVRALEAFRRQHGRYPGELAEAGARPRWNRHGGWHYEPFEEGSAFRLRCGDYDRDDFVLYREPRTGDWDEDG